MGKFKLLFALLLGIWVPFTQAWAEDPPGVENAHVVEFGDGKSKQTFSKLVIGDLPELHTRILYAKRGLWFKEAKGLVFIFPGTGAKVDSDYGIERSLAPIANELLKQGYAVAAFQPPVYWQGSDESIQNYKSLEPNLSWQLEVFEYGNKACKGPLDNHYIGRSTGSGWGTELLHRYLRGDAKFRSVSNFKSMLLMSIDGHTENDIRRWETAEAAASDSLMNRRVTTTSAEMYREMRWQTERVPVPSGIALPNVTLVAAARDEFTSTSVSLGAIRDFFQMHPGLGGGVAVHDGFHEPARGDKSLGIDPMSRLRLILSHSLVADAYPASVMTPLLFPDEEAVFRALNERGPDELGICKTVLGIAG